MSPDNNFIVKRDAEQVLWTVKPAAVRFSSVKFPQRSYAQL